MKAVILAAGIGSRLYPLTNRVPKPLVEVGGKPILEYQIDALMAAGISDIVVCTGHLGDQISSFCDSRDLQVPIRIVHNADFMSTNNMFSLYLAREHLEGDVFIMNADVCFESEVLEGLMRTKGSAVAVDVGTYNEESMKIVVDGGRIVDIAKTIPRDRAYGCSIDVYKFEAQDVQILVSGLVAMIEEERQLNQWTEVLLRRLFTSGQLLARPSDIRGKWLEIDNSEDLNQAERLFNPRYARLADARLFLFDRDGTLSLGEHLIEGAAEVLHCLLDRGKPYYLLTNNSSRTSAQHAARMKELPLGEERVLVSTDALIAYLRRQSIRRIHLSATRAVSDHFVSVGFELDSIDPEAAVLTYNTELTYADLTSFVESVASGHPYFATHTDLLYPYERGFLPDIGTFIDMIEKATSRRPDMQFGKPAPSIVTHLFDEHDVTADQAVIIGDRLYTDIALGNATGMTTVLVLSGETSREDLLMSRWQPDVIVNSVGDLLPLFEEAVDNP